MKGFTHEQLADECDREAGKRVNVYARLVRAGKMSAELAERRISMMEAAAEKIRELYALQHGGATGDLFEGA